MGRPSSCGLRALQLAKCLLMLVVRREMQIGTHNCVGKAWPPQLPLRLIRAKCDSKAARWTETQDC